MSDQRSSGNGNGRGMAQAEKPEAIGDWEEWEEREWCV